MDNGTSPETVKFGDQPHQYVDAETASRMLRWLFAHQPGPFGKALQAALGLEGRKAVR